MLEQEQAPVLEPEQEQVRGQERVQRQDQPPSMFGHLHL
jgi:hypothetical protein